ncbi:neutral amino acid transporter [Coelomomyces lativittatus]|nr:neutral amino acid transporter [Coelomomyces lativittatus]
MIILAEVYQEVPGSFEDLGGKVYGPWFRHLILFSVAISQLGFCVAYYGFVAKTGESLLHQFNVHLGSKESLFYFIFAQALVYIPLTFFRQIQKLSGVSFLANALIFAGLIVICVFAGQQIQQAPSQTLNVGFRWDGFDEYFGTALYTFEGIGLVVPITQSMKQPEKFKWATSMSMLVTMVIYLMVASLGAFAYGENAKLVVLGNLPIHNAALVVHFFYIVAIMMSWPLVAYPAIEIIQKICLPHGRGRFSLKDKWKKNGLRASVVVVTAVLAFFSAPYLELVLTIIGCLFCVPLSFIYPAMLHYKVFRHQSKKSKLLDLLLGVFGMVAMILAFTLLILKGIEGKLTEGGGAH